MLGKLILIQLHLYQITLHHPKNTLTSTKYIYNMAHRSRAPEVEEAPEVIKNDRPQKEDQMPLKDEFSSDLSDIDLAELAERQEEALQSQKTIRFKPKKRKTIKPYEWKKKWVCME